MHHQTWVRWTAAVVLAGASVIPAVFAQESPKTLPSLLIKGEVVSVDTSDPAAALLKVRDRYGFETPIYLSKETKVAEGDQTLTVADLTSGKAVEVEYNFDINTAKRHAVNVTVSAPVAATTAPAAPAATTASPAPAPPSTATPSSVAPAPAETPAPPAQPAESATKEHPGTTSP